MSRRHHFHEGQGRAREERRKQIRPWHISLFFCFGIKQILPFPLSCLLASLLLELPVFRPSFLHSQIPQSRLKPWHSAGSCRGRREAAEYGYHGLPLPGPTSAFPPPPPPPASPLWLAAFCIHGVSMGSWRCSFPLRQSSRASVTSSSSPRVW